MPAEINADQKERLEFIICPECSGAKKVKNKICSTCGGLGLGAFHEGAFLYWGTALSGPENRYRRQRRVFFQFINIITLFLGVFYSAVFCYRLIFIRGLQLEPFWPWFFGSDPARLWLAGGALALMFAYYRLRVEAAEAGRINFRAYEERARRLNLPNNWTELKKAHSLLGAVGASFNPEAMRLAESAYQLALTNGQAEIKPLHLFIAALADRQVAAFFSRLSVNGAVLIEKVKRQMAKLPADLVTEPRPGLDFQEVMIMAYVNAWSLRQKQVEPVHFLAPLLSKDPVLKEILYELSVDLDKTRNLTAWFAINRQLQANYERYKRAVRYKPATAMDRAYTAMATPLLNSVGTDLTIAAKWGKLEFTVGREAALEEIFNFLAGGKNGILLVGPDGAGKTAVLYALAQRMAAEDVPRILRDKRLVEVDFALLLGGADPAQAQQRLLEIIREVQRAGNVILVMENLENIMGISAGTEESLDLSEVLANAIRKFGLFCLATASELNFRKYLEGKYLAESMAKVDVAPPDKNEAIRIIESKVGAWEGRLNVYLSYNAIAAAVDLTEKFLHDRQLPEKAIEVLKQAAIRAGQEKGGSSLVTEEDVATIISEITKIPSAKISDRESEILLRLEEKIHERMINQEEAVSAVSAALRRARAQMNEGKRPIANFLFLGPTGVGKTELAKTVADVYFGREQNMIRVDMSEYQEADSVKKMIGDPSGIAGHLTEAVRRQPFALVLLDEFEKAHPDILNLFLQVMDDGRLTDGQGRTINFTNAIIIATSNIGANFIKDQVLNGRALSALKDELMNEHLPRALRPELINRFDGVILFEPLSMTHVLEITKLMMKKISVLLEKKGVTLVCEEEGLRVLAAQGYDPQFGARPLRRLLQDKIEAQIANLVIAGGLKRRDTVIINSQAQVRVEKAAPL